MMHLVRVELNAIIAFFPLLKGISGSVLQEIDIFLQNRPTKSEFAPFLLWEGRLCYARAMVPLPERSGEDDLFASTHWSVVLAAADSTDGPEAAKAALSQLCHVYWAPLYAFVRRRGHSMHDAQDHAKFFCVPDRAKNLCARQSTKRKIQSLPARIAQEFLSDAYDRDHALKRGGGRIFLPLFEDRAEEAESLFQSSVEAGEDKISEDQVFEQNWAETLVTGALNRVRDEYKTSQREDLFENLQMFVTGSADPLPSVPKNSLRVLEFRRPLSAAMSRDCAVIIAKLCERKCGAR